GDRERRVRGHSESAAAVRTAGGLSVGKTICRRPAGTGASERKTKATRRNGNVVRRAEEKHERRGAARRPAIRNRERRPGAASACRTNRAGGLHRPAGQWSHLRSNL